MKNTFKILMIVSMVAILFSCKKTDEFLNKEPLGDYSELVVWSDPVLVQTFVNNMYYNALGFPFAIQRTCGVSDETFFTHDYGTNDFNKGLMTPDTYYGWNFMARWNPLYSNVRRTNIFFSKINSVPADKKAVLDELKGQVYFLRALNYFYLTSVYGGVPIITKAYTLTDQFEIPRNTYEECISFVVGQLDSAFMYLPEVYATDGHATKGAALALKSRVLLYAASDLHNPAKNGIVTSGFFNPELLGYTGGDAAARWTAAKNAAKDVIDLNKYNLYKGTPAPGDSVAQNFVDFFTSKGTGEDILLHFFNPKSPDNLGLYDQPNGYHCWSSQTPLAEMVDDFEMKDGSKFDWNNPVHKANPYINRDARFYASVLYEGVTWRVRPSDGLVIDPFSKIQVGYVYNNANGVMLKPGLDTRLGPIENWNGGYSGYFLRKFIDFKVDPQYVTQDVPFKHIRYAEVLLNYAEACIELGEDAEASTYINMIRTRAGQPDLPVLTGDALRQAYRHERRIELAFEDHRFWDVQRWLIGSATHHQTHGIDVRYETSETAVAAYRKADGSTYGAPIFNLKEIAGDVRAWPNKCYFFPILRDEMNKNTKLIQNPGY